RNSSASPLIQESPSGPYSCLRPAKGQFTPQEKFPGDAFGLPGRSLARPRAPRTGNMLDIRRCVRWLKRGGEYVAFVAQPLQVLVETIRPRSTNGVGGWEVIRD